MKFEQLRISGFARLRDLDLDFGDGLTVVAGPNEAGKSTIVECLIRLLYGFPEAQHNKPRKRYEPWAPGAPYQATLRYRLDDGRACEVYRDFGRQEVPTMVVDASTHRTLSTGNKSTAPGEDALHISMDAYRAAAVVTAGDFVAETNGAVQPLAERLAEVVGSAGDASAAEAIERLKAAHAAIGSTGAATPLGRAKREADDADAALRRFQDERREFEETIRDQADLAERAHDLAGRRSRCAAALGAVELRAVRARITEAVEAQRRLDAATAHLAAHDGAASSAAAFERRYDVDAATLALRTAQARAAEAVERANARTAERQSLQREVDAASAVLLEKRAHAAHVDKAIAAHEASAADRPTIDAATLASLEREADDADTAEANARRLQTQAAIVRQRSQPSALIALISAFLAIILGGAWLVTHVLAAGVAAIVAVVMVAIGSWRYARQSSVRKDAIARAESAAAEATTASDRAAAAMASRCRALGCPSVSAVRAARTAQLEIDGLRAERDAARDAADLGARHRDTLMQRLADFDALSAARRTSAELVDARLADLNALLDHIGIAPGDVDSRIAAYHSTRDADEAAARGEAAVAKAQADLARALAGGTIASLEDEAARYAAEAAAGGDPGEFADRTREELEAELKSLNDELNRTERSRTSARARADEFDRAHAVPPAELEERAAAAAQRRDRLQMARGAMELACDVIAEVRDRVHRDFTPPLNAAVARAVATITDGRYVDARVDQSDFKIRVQAPETTVPQERAALSTGTAEQLQFALRTALATTLAGGGERVPMLFDDALVHTDDARVRAALAFAAGLACDGSQIILFTQHASIEAAAADLPGVRVLRLAGPAERADVDAASSAFEATQPEGSAAHAEPAELPGFEL